MKQGAAKAGAPVVKIFAIQQGELYIPGKHRWNAKLCQPTDLPSNGYMGEAVEWY
jgi:hypothetical protein